MSGGVIYAGGGVAGLMGTEKAPRVCTLPMRGAPGLSDGGVRVMEDMSLLLDRPFDLANLLFEGFDMLMNLVGLKR